MWQKCGNNFIFFSLVKKINYCGASWVSIFIESCLNVSNIFLENFFYPFITKSLILLFFMSSNGLLQNNMQNLCGLLCYLNSKYKYQNMMQIKVLNGIFLKNNGQVSKYFWGVATSIYLIWFFFPFQYFFLSLSFIYLFYSLFDIILYKRIYISQVITGLEQSYVTVWAVCVCVYVRTCVMTV